MNYKHFGAHCLFPKKHVYQAFWLLLWWWRLADALSFCDCYVNWKMWAKSCLASPTLCGKGDFPSCMAYVTIDPFLQYFDQRAGCEVYQDTLMIQKCSAHIPERTPERLFPASLRVFDDMMNWCCFPLIWEPSPCPPPLPSLLSSPPPHHLLQLSSSPSFSTSPAFSSISFLSFSFSAYSAYSAFSDSYTISSISVFRLFLCSFRLQHFHRQPLFICYEVLIL